MVKSIPPIFYEDKDLFYIQKIKKRHGGNWHDFLMDSIRSLETKFEKDGIDKIERFEEE